MSNIQNIDKNFKRDEIRFNNLKFHNITSPPFQIYGVFKAENEFIRMPREIAKKVSANVCELNRCTSGGRVRFKTDSKRIILRCRMPHMGQMPHMPETGRCGFDLYAGNKYIKTFIPPLDFETGFEYEAEFETNEIRDIIINFPTYNGVYNIEIGLESDAGLKESEKYKYEIPAVFYGSSITQGGCVSRPGNMYQNILSRRLDFDYINLGFSGSALAEDAMAEYIAKIPMSAFIYDYDHNAPTAEHLRNTHYKMFEKIRKTQPDIPIILASAPSPCFGKEISRQRTEIIKETFNMAKKDGDKNIYFINGADMFNCHDPEMMTVDGTHPNDFGFFCMAEQFEKVLKNIYI